MYSIMRTYVSILHRFHISTKILRVLPEGLLILARPSGCEACFSLFDHNFGGQQCALSKRNYAVWGAERFSSKNFWVSC